jgi:hypothetical protein
MLVRPSIVTAVSLLARGDNPIITSTKPTTMVSTITMR